MARKALQTSELVAALEAAWREVRAAHREIPAAVIVMASGSGSRGSVKAGHFAADRWRDGRVPKKKGKKAAALIHEVLISGEGLAEGGADVMDTLLHEGAHALARAREVSDTSRGGRYHNMRFKLLAEELGLVVETQGTQGWAHTELSAPTRKRWAKVIKALDKAIAKSFRLRDPEGEPKPAPSRMLKAQCQCPERTGAEARTIRIARKVFEIGAITCGECDMDFALCEEG